MSNIVLSGVGLVNGQPGKAPLTIRTKVGQPVSLENINQVAEFCHSRKLKLYIDAARFTGDQLY